MAQAVRYVAHRSQSQRTLSSDVFHQNLPENQCIFVRGFRVKRSFKMFPRVKGAVEPPPDPSGNNDEREIEVVLIASAPKVRILLLFPRSNLGLQHQDPLHVLLECIAKVNTSLRKLT
jgi:hypothetical protein